MYINLLVFTKMPFKNIDFRGENSTSYKVYTANVIALWSPHAHFASLSGIIIGSERSPLFYSQLLCPPSSAPPDPPTPVSHSFQVHSPLLSCLPPSLPRELIQTSVQLVNGFKPPMYHWRGLNHLPPYERGLS